MFILGVSPVLLGLLVAFPINICHQDPKDCYDTKGTAGKLPSPGHHPQFRETLSWHPSVGTETPRLILHA